MWPLLLGWLTFLVPVGAAIAAITVAVRTSRVWTMGMVLLALMLVQLALMGTLTGPALVRVANGRFSPTMASAAFAIVLWLWMAALIVYSMCVFRCGLLLRRIRELPGGLWAADGKHERWPVSGLVRFYWFRAMLALLLAASFALSAVVLTGAGDIGAALAGWFMLGVIALTVLAAILLLPALLIDLRRRPARDH